MIKCLVIAEHEEEGKHITDLVNAFDFYRVIPSASKNESLSGKKAFLLPDVVILEGNKLSEKDLERIKKAGNNPFTIVIASSAQQAIRAYELGIEDFILKPLKKERLIRDLSVARERLLSRPGFVEGIINDGFFFVREKDSLKKIKWDDVLYFQALGDYINMFTTHKKATLHSNLKNLASFLPEEKFVRIHRSYIVNISKVDRITGNSAYINSGSIPIGDAFRARFISFLKVLK